MVEEEEKKEQQQRAYAIPSIGIEIVLRMFPSVWFRSSLFGTFNREYERSTATTK